MSALPPVLGSTPSSAVALIGAGDPGSSRLVYAMVIGLVVVGVGLIVLGIWIIRQTRADLEVLAPLERMGDGDWKKRDRSTQRRMLDELRPEGASPLTPATQPPSLDDEFEQADHPVTSFSDLGPGIVSEQRDPTPVGRTDDLLFDDVADAPAEEDAGAAELDEEAPAEENVRDELADADVAHAPDDEVTDDEVTDDEVTDEESVGVPAEADDDDELDDDGGAMFGVDDDAMSDPRG